MISTEEIKEIEKKAVKKKVVDKRRLYDRIAKWVVTAGGIAIILSILAILFFISIEVFPLWQKPKYELLNKLNIVPTSASELLNESVSNEVVLVGTEEYREIAIVLFKSGQAKFISLKDGSALKEIKLENLEEDYITSTYVSANNKSFAVGTYDGKIIPFDVNYRIKFEDNGSRKIIPELIESDPIKVSYDSIADLAYKKSEDGLTYVAAFLNENGQLILYSSSESEDSFLEEAEITETAVDLTGELGGAKATTIEVDSFLDNLYISTEQGKILNWNIKDKENPVLKSVVNASSDSGTAVTALGFLLGNRSLLVGDGVGNVSVWFQVKDEQNQSKLKKVHTFPPLKAEITEFSKSPRDRGFIASDKSGNIGIFHATTDTKQLEIKGEGSAYSSITFSPKANGIITVDKDGQVKNWFLDNPHPETNFKTLFEKVWYEGYSEPQYVWQSTGGTDEFEPKFSLTPLIYGTLKGSFYALFFAIPLAIFGAICVSQFMHPSLRNVIKPVIEIMAALPSVVLGFFAGLWMAPRIEKIFPAVLLMFILIPLVTVLAVYIWKRLPKTFTGRFRVGTELFLLIPIVVLAILVSLLLNGTVESLLFSGDYKSWFYENWGLQYDQRNALIVGFAMGFAVIPIIFTISEDAISSVPKNLTAGSLALGANIWQTATRIVVPSASAGIFSAVMIGLGRAVGETMIVLMATGNTPVMDWSFFNGFRALSANIAVELPEAPHGGTLYRILFLAALLLFAFTFILNTIAEIVRQRLRKKYGQL